MLDKHVKLLFGPETVEVGPERGSAYQGQPFSPAADLGEREEVPHHVGLVSHHDVNVAAPQSGRLPLPERPGQFLHGHLRIVHADELSVRVVRLA